MNQTGAPSAEIDALEYRRTLGHFPTGVAAVTGIADDGTEVAMVVGSFVSVSLDPPLVAFLPMRESRTFAQLRTAPSFCVNVLAHDQESLSRRLARGGAGSLARETWAPSPSGAPMLDSVIATIDCTWDSVTEAGDHYIAIGRVQHLEVANPTAPLVFFQGGYGSYAPASLIVRDDAGIIASVRAAEKARPLLEAVSAKLDATCSVMAVAGTDIITVAAAAAPGRLSTFEVGQRLPLLPPLGEIFMAYAPDDEVEAWLTRAVPGSRRDALMSFARERREQIRARGWASSSLQLSGDALEALQQYSRAEVTPARMKELHLEIARSTRQFLDHADEDPVASISVPVFDANGQIRFALAATDFGLTPAPVDDVVQIIEEAARQMGLALSCGPQDS